MKKESNFTSNDSVDLGADGKESNFDSNTSVDLGAAGPEKAKAPVESSKSAGGHPINKIQTGLTTLGVAAVGGAIGHFAGKKLWITIAGAVAGAVAGFFIDAHVQKAG